MASPEEAVAVAERFVNAWVDGRFDDAHGALGEPLASRETAVRLGERWSALTAAHGPFTSVGRGTAGTNLGMAVVEISVRLERALLSLDVVVNERNQVDDFLLALSPD